MASARRCITCKVLFKNINALDDHCALTTHPSRPHRCLPCNRAYRTPSDLQSHLAGSAKHQRRTQISAQRSQASHDGATQPVPYVTLTTNKVEDRTQIVCRPCKLRFENPELLLEHYRTSNSSRHPYCSICPQVFVKRKALKKHMAKYHPQSLLVVLPTSKSEDHRTQITIPAPPVNPPAIFPTQPIPQLELLEDDDFVLVEKSSLVLRTPETPTSASSSSIPQTENANPALPKGLFKCPGCHTQFHPFSKFVIHIDSGACSSASMSQQINNEINAFAVQLFRNFSLISG